MVNVTDTERAIRRPFFEIALEPSPGGSTTFLPPLQKIWEKNRARGIAPRWRGELDDTPELRAEFLVGASMMGYELVDLEDPEQLAELDLMEPPRLPLQPQQLLIADALNAGTKRNAIEVPRRASKSTTVFCLLLGRCAMRPGYRVVFSAQTGTAGTEMFEEWVKDGLDYVQPPADADLPPWKRGDLPRRVSPELAKWERFGQMPLYGDLEPADDQPRSMNTSGRTFRTRVGNSRPGIRFDNHSTFRVLKPEASAYRGKAADVSWLDEAQEIDPAESNAIVAGVLPLMDTRPGSQIIVSGTAGEAKAGAFWTNLDRLRRGDPALGGVDFAIDQMTDWSDIEDEDRAMQLVERTHPGVGTLTNMETMRDNYRDPAMGKPQWAREYLSLWPDVGQDVVIDPLLWDGTALERWPDRPARVAFGMDIRPGGGATAAICAAWRDREGRAFIELVDHQLGTAWLPARLQYLTRQGYRGSSVAFDKIAEGEATYIATRYIHPRPKLQMQTWSETAAGCVTFMRELETGTLRHYASQGALNAAALDAKKREIRGNDRGVWIFTAEQGKDVTPLLAAVRALRNWDQYYERGYEAEQAGIISA
ncbi:hypothetical protein FB468_2066 [Leucobacter komagatae]|uniref:Phage terminase large subunit-like protein n=2 Tax=Leucobacter komagatae TaxID=55969 RepID=A0A542Y7F2_9MICO|nr:hypothetical protein FB468_2066 [Leucobacter komagatae]